MDKLTNKSEYLGCFEGEYKLNKKREEALKQAVDIRKFEIDLYWKRTTYFWTLIAAIFAGFFAIQKISPTSNEQIYLVSCIRLVFSFG